MYAVGIDEQFAVVDFNSKQVALNIELSFPYHEARVVSTSIVLACELEVLIIDIHNYHVIDWRSLPDIYYSMDLEGDKVNITFMDGNVVSIQIK
ncbi:hypothetical protein [Mucilaginibacter rubeus]|uniref:Uncharacterized protein n=1 Tax=Mucilaginibacter rubeus TaxID=2027860 RepID=A0A5C1HUB6_9SPHI|nr:hypothetical protein [Mucilaginibacter rubeus]QEM09103.1 hypothetical protein DEO27_003420 [Mucilaginibacter rubeus]